MNTNILIVDDNENNLYSLEKTILEYIEDVTILKAQSGDVALEIAYRQQIDLIILDIQMPLMGGFDVAKYLNVNPKTKHIPIIFLTAVFKEEEFVHKGFSLGAIDYLTKPLEDTKLINQIKLYIRIFSKDRMNKILEDKVKEETEKRLEKERILFEQSKMITMGEMMSNIAHQWRQPLAAIVNTIDYIELRCSNDTLSKEELKNELDNIAESSIFLSHTIDTFRNFFKEDKVIATFHLSTVVSETLSLVDKNLKHYNIKVETNVPDISMRGYKQELQHAMLNIVNNAKDVLSEKKELHTRVLYISSIEKNDKIQIKIKDSGGGIPSHIINKIFEPYFTTKHKNQGTGIGLYMTYEMITVHMQGEITVYNEEFVYNDTHCNGAVFTITIPKNIE